jgi:hypothetical protein
MAKREHPADRRCWGLPTLRKAVGFDAYYEAEKAYTDSRN